MKKPWSAAGATIDYRFSLDATIEEKLERLREAIFAIAELMNPSPKYRARLDDAIYNLYTLEERQDVHG